MQSLPTAAEPQLVGGARPRWSLPEHFLWCQGETQRPLPLAGHELSRSNSPQTAPPEEKPAAAGAVRAARGGHVFKV